jgi:hypothetical protein
MGFAVAGVPAAGVVLNAINVLGVPALVRVPILMFLSLPTRRSIKFKTALLLLVSLTMLTYLRCWRPCCG